MARLTVSPALRRLRRRRARTPAGERYAQAPLPAAGTPWREAAFAVLDLETTGLDARGDEIIQFGVVPVEGGRIAVAGMVEGLVRPTRMPARANVEIHGIRPADLAAAPVGEVAFEPLLDALAGRVLVAHAAHVERAFLRPALGTAGVRLRGDVIDTALLWRLEAVRSGRPDPGLVALGRLAAALALPAHRPHHALGDALTTAQCLLALASRLERQGGAVVTVGVLASARRRLELQRRFAP